MDDFVQKKLIEWDLKKWIDKFEDEEITEESFYELNDELIDKLIPKVGPGLKFKKRLKQLKEKQHANRETVHCSAQQQEEAPDLDQVLPSTSDEGKRKFEHQDKSSKQQPPAKRQRSCKPRSSSEPIILSDVQNIMRFVHGKLHDQDKLNVFLKKKINDLKTDKRELVGVFGKTGAGKSSLINAIIEERNLLPSGSVTACTSVMIKVEANLHSDNYEADIEFITKEEWKDELWPWQQILGDNENHKMEVDDDYCDIIDKLSALYGEEWKQKSIGKLLDSKYFKEIPEFLQCRRKILSCESAKELSARCAKYTRSDSKQGDGKNVKRWYWPLVKCVTLRVPNNDFLQHVTLVDLPGNGDRNKSRDKMWKQIVGDCSTVWIVTEINRAIAEKEAWDILESASSLIGNGGECRQIHFICTKSDQIEDSDDYSAAQRRNRITERNMQVKEEVRKEFSKLKKIKKHFTDDCFKVFTVSSKEFLKQKRLNPDETEIPKLCEFLQDLNDCHSETLNYVSGALGILSLIQGANCRGGVEKADDVCKVLEKNMNEQLDEVERAVEKAIKAFDQCLREGVENSITSEEKLKLFLDRDRKQPGFFKTLQSVVKKDGTHKTTKGEQIDLNMMLASCLTDSIDEKFRKTFPNDVKGGSFNGVISQFSLDTKSLIQKYKVVELQLIFLQTEEDKIKAQVNKTILTQKKIIYNSLTETVEKNMKKGYEDAAEIIGEGALKKMRKTIETHVYSNKKMYEEAKETLLMKMNDLKATILKELKETMKYSIKLSLKTDTCQLPDVSKHLQSVKKHYHELKRSQDEETSAQ
ncbi:nuclear GTPase SLIP-GC-like [Archocentrus centrarchus]|uniref:nuclear GTPase SLIP-GC-like n=1 Tax=Archocentrus centrarchus TaxID=63155 RepID=UPI0011E9C3F0|nr:nuclear GTPase SLIP-GC-like [Archocentrus centrarchus]